MFTISTGTWLSQSIWRPKSSQNSEASAVITFPTKMSIPSKRRGSPLMVQGGWRGHEKGPTAHCNLVMSRPCRKACILIKKAGTFDGCFFSRNFVCFKSISLKKHIYFRVYNRTLKQNPRKMLVWRNQWHMISCDRVQCTTSRVVGLKPRHTMGGFLSNHFARFHIPPLRLGDFIHH